MSEQTTLPAVAAHGARRLPSVDVDSYNVELKDSQGFIGDRASKGAFRNMIDRIRKSMRKAGDDPLGDEDSDELTKAELDVLLLRGEPEAAGLVHAAIEDFSQEFRIWVAPLSQRMPRICLASSPVSAVHGVLEHSLFPRYQTNCTSRPSILAASSNIAVCRLAAMSQVFSRDPVASTAKTSRPRETRVFSSNAATRGEI